MSGSDDITFQFRRDTAADWATKNPVLGPGEPAIENDTNKFKLGDGRSRWSELEYFIDKTSIQDLIESFLDNLDHGVVATQTQLDVGIVNHITAANPHPAYDDGVPFTLLYENAKV